VVSVPDEQPDRPVVRVRDGSGSLHEISLLLEPQIRIAGWDSEPAAAAA
jgi:hypothetical protein